MLQVRGLAVEVGGKRLIENVNFTVADRDKVGIVGRNGAGKTSLLRVLGGENPPAAGQVVVKGGFGYLPQDPRIAGHFDGRDAVTHVLSGRGVDEEMERLEKLRLAMEEHPDDRSISRYTRAQERFEISGGYAAEAEARALAAGLGLDDIRMATPIGALSGGERRRVELARILFAGSDVLCLDEPTNHLDVDAKEWLMAYMRSYRGALIVISHDLELLDEAITRVIHLDRPTENALGTVVEYKGTYSQYVAAREADEVRQAKVAERQSKEIARLQGVVDRFGAKATKAAMAHSIEKRIGRLEATRVDGPQATRVMRVKLPTPPPAGRTVVTATGLAKAFGDRVVFTDASFQVGRGERMLVLGLNGAGKTTLLRILAGEVIPDSGDIGFGHQVTVGYYAQEHDNLDPSRSLLDNLRRAVPPTLNLTETELRGVLGMFRLSADNVFQDAGTLSGGEKTKLALAMLMVGRNNVLLLDEPTNNLDPASRTAIAEALQSWPGSIIFVSHDPEFVVDLAPTQVVLMPDGQVDYFNESWLELVELA